MCTGRRRRRPSSRQIRLANTGLAPTAIAWVPTSSTTSTRCTRRNSFTARRTATWHSCRVSSAAQPISSVHIHKRDNKYKKAQQQQSKEYKACIFLFLARLFLSFCTLRRRWRRRRRGFGGRRGRLARCQLGQQPICGTQWGKCSAAGAAQLVAGRAISVAAGCDCNKAAAPTVAHAGSANDVGSSSITKGAAAETKPAGAPAELQQ